MEEALVSLTWRNPKPPQSLVLLPFTEELCKNHAAVDGLAPAFELLHDPNETEEAAIVGMFVVRPAFLGDDCPLNAAALPESLFAAKAWVHNIIGSDGGGALSNGNVFDAYRLALQYGLSDAVMVSSKTVAIEGVSHEGREGYVWVASSVCAWSHLTEFDPHLLDKIAAQRHDWQQRGFLSKRQCPAQIIVTESGRVHEGSSDFLDARVFSECQHGTDNVPLEVLILTSTAGAARIRERVSSVPALAALTAEQIENMLLVCSNPGRPEVLDLASVRALLYRSRGIKICNHDGGLVSLRQFTAAGALTQLNLSLGRGLAVRELPLNASCSDDDELGRRLEYFWGDVAAGHSGAMPRALDIVAIHADAKKELAVCVIDTRSLKGRDFYNLPEGV